MMHVLHVSDVKFARATDISQEGTGCSSACSNDKQQLKIGVLTLQNSARLVKQEKTKKHKFSAGKFRFEILDFLSKKKIAKESVN